MDLGLEVESFREARCGCSFSEGRVRVDRIGRDCELEICKILLMVDPEFLYGCKRPGERS